MGARVRLPAAGGPHRRGAGIGTLGEGVGRAANFLTQILLARFFGAALGLYTISVLVAGLAATSAAYLFRLAIPLPTGLVAIAVIGSLFAVVFVPGRKGGPGTPRP